MDNQMSSHMKDELDRHITGSEDRFAGMVECPTCDYLHDEDMCPQCGTENPEDTKEEQ